MTCRADVPLVETHEDFEMVPVPKREPPATSPAPVTPAPIETAQPSDRLAVEIDRKGVTFRGQVSWPTLRRGMLMTVATFAIIGAFVAGR
jgi:hypothetical protein